MLDIKEQSFNLNEMLKPSLLKDATAVMIVYSIDSLISFEDID